MGLTKQLDGRYNETDQTEERQMVTINTLQRTTWVERIAVDQSFKRNRSVKYYDLDNLYPNKIKSIAERSCSTITGINTLSSFITGDGFDKDEVNKMIVNSDEQTLYDILRHVSSEKSMFSGFALHFNYNIFGEIIEINEICFEDLRWKNDMSMLIHNTDWRKPNKRDLPEYYPFNPDPAKVKEEIAESKGIENYKGQVLYWQPRKKDIYPLCRFDSVLDFAQFEAEAAIYMLSNIQNDYSLGGVLKIPSIINDDKELTEIKRDIRNSKGSANAGKIWALTMTPTPELMNNKLFEPITRNNIDGLFNNQLDRAESKIFAKFQQATILNGIAKNGMFNQDQFQDAFDYYNSFTQTDRDEAGRVINKILVHSIWANVGEVAILPKSYIMRESEQTNTNQNTSTDAGSSTDNQ